MSQNTSRPLDSGRRDSLGRTIKVSEQDAAGRADAPTPGRTSADIGDDTVAVLVDDLIAELDGDGLDPATPFTDLHDVCDPNQYVADIIEERLGDMPWSRLLDLGNRVIDGYEDRRLDPTTPPIPEQWANVGVTSLDAVTRLEDRGHIPDDFTDPNRDIRMSACAARGDLTFEGELLSHAAEISQHSDRADLSNRRAIIPRWVTGGHPTDQERLQAEAAYIDGYASGLHQIAELRDRLGADWQNAAIRDRGWQFPGVDEPELDTIAWRVRREAFKRAFAIEQLRDQMEAGHILPTVTIHTPMSVSGRADLVDVTRHHDGNWSGKLASDEQRWTEHGETRPRFIGQPEWFQIDQINPYPEQD